MKNVANLNFEGKTCIRNPRLIALYLGLDLHAHTIYYLLGKQLVSFPMTLAVQHGWFNLLNGGCFSAFQKHTQIACHFLDTWTIEF